MLAQVKGIAFTQFTAADVVRHPLVARIVDAYAARGQADADVDAPTTRRRRAASVPTPAAALAT